MRWLLASYHGCKRFAVETSFLLPVRCQKKISPATVSVHSITTFTAWEDVMRFSYTDKRLPWRLQTGPTLRYRTPSPCAIQTRESLIVRDYYHSSIAELTTYPPLRERCVDEETMLSPFTITVTV